MDVLLILSKWCAVQKSQQTLKNGANGFDGYFLAFYRQTTHRANHGETGRESGCSQRKPEVFVIFIEVIVLIIIVLVQIFGIGGVKIKLVIC